MRTVAAFLLVLASAVPAAAQTSDDSISIQAFGMVAGEAFSATKTFDAVFDKSFGIFGGGGLELTTPQNWYLDVAISRFSKTGERAFISNGTTFHLGIPVTATLIPIEATAGYRFRLGDSAFRRYVGAGVGSYGYKETSPSSVSLASDNVDVHHLGFLAVVGAQFRLNTWVSVALDGQYTSISGILGDGGVSEQVGEKNLGGIAGRFRILVGK